MGGAELSGQKAGEICVLSQVGIGMGMGISLIWVDLQSGDYLSRHPPHTTDN